MNIPPRRANSELRLIVLDAATRARCLALRVRPDQQAFIPTVDASLALAALYPDARPLAVVVGERVIGFAMYGVDQASGTWKIYRLLIDAASQGAGMGRAAVRALIRILAEEHGAESILVSYHSENVPARRLYLSEGFRELEMDAGKVTARWTKPLTRDRAAAEDRLR
ncbi:MAG: GNAT family N-acetyltransferase [Candidatus Eisenbacteria bacterium]|nr:GNAT family N-acetyltransferase [Candidatus Eisenbacteria bacterium]MCC7142347.1 GNAT family N-acetyltransferase [Candidatus Eisenbacteria bacterium]